MEGIRVMEDVAGLRGQHTAAQVSDLVDAS
jgi:hypothetical protein